MIIIYKSMYFTESLTERFKYFIDQNERPLLVYIGTVENLFERNIKLWNGYSQILNTEFLLEYSDPVYRVHKWTDVCFNLSALGA